MARTISYEDLWFKLRGCENAFRYYSDVIIAVGEYLEQQGVKTDITVTDQALAAAFQSAFPDDPPIKIPTRCPPWCQLTAHSVNDGLDQLGKIADATLRISQLLAKQLEGTSLGPDGLEAYVSEKPGTSWKEM